MDSLDHRKDSRVSRITTACNPCRARKQKCSGERPSCRQCLDNRRQCAWPEQLKRGPAKGYIEALETRLYETENVLLTLLSHISEPQLTSMLSENEHEASKGNQIRLMQKLGHFSRQKEAEYWKANPLNTVENVRKWEQECLNLRNRPETSNLNANKSTRQSRGARPSTKAKPDDLFGRAITTKSPGHISENHSFHTNQDQASHSRYYGEEDSRNTEASFWNTSTVSPDETRTVRIDSSTHHETNLPSTTHMPQISKWKEAPPISFQKQFLW